MTTATASRSEEPLVSAVIPTHLRPDLAVRAVRSALGQSLKAIEVVVVVDGRDQETVSALAEVRDPRLRVIVPETHLGNAEARNAGILAARAQWIALLDDDDLWMPGKLEAQLRAGEAAPVPTPIVACRLIADTGSARFVWPRRTPRGGQNLSEYLFCRHWPSTGDGVVQTSTIMAPARLFRECPFRHGSGRFVDVDWLLRASIDPSVGLVFPEGLEPLSVWSIEDRPRISLEAGWRRDVAWIDARRDLVTPRSHAAFLLTLASIRAARDGDRKAFHVLLREAFRKGTPGWAEVAFHIGNFAMPVALRRRLASHGNGTVSG